MSTETYKNFSVPMEKNTRKVDKDILQLLLIK